MNCWLNGEKKNKLVGFLYTDETLESRWPGHERDVIVRGPGSNENRTGKIVLCQEIVL